MDVMSVAEELEVSLDIGKRMAGESSGRKVTKQIGITHTQDMIGLEKSGHIKNYVHP